MQTLVGDMPHTQRPVAQTPSATPAVREVAPDIYQVRLPLPFALNHVNCYLLRDEEGWTMVDTGLDQPNVRAAWHEACTLLELEPQQIQRIVLTHMHPDHFGLSGYFQHLTNAPVYLSARERELAQTVWMEDGWRPELVAEYWRMGGIPNDVRGVISDQTERLRYMTMPHPHEIATLEAGEIVHMGGRDFLAIHAPGHSDGQLIFYSAADQLMLCGDQVLKSITPNIGLWPSTEADPLGRYLESLNELMALPVLLALPGHGSVMTTEWQARLCALEEHHRVRLEETRRAVEGGATALEVSRRLFNYGKLSEHEVRFAVAEAMAHLDYLARRGVITFSDNGARHYSA
jgi:glyoxylase-like metal-dependent hydrolase (beta-lactamase superfamily II)